MFVDMTSEMHTIVPQLVWTGEAPLDASTLAEGDMLVVDTRFAAILEGCYEGYGVESVAHNAKAHWLDTRDRSDYPSMPKVKRVIAAARVRGWVRGVDVRAYDSSLRAVWLAASGTRCGFGVVSSDGRGGVLSHHQYGRVIVSSPITTADLTPRQRRDFIAAARGIIGRTPMSRWLVTHTEPVPLPPHTGPGVDRVNRAYIERHAIALRRQRRALGEAFREWLSDNSGGYRGSCCEADLAEALSNARDYGINTDGVTEHREVRRYSEIRQCDCCEGFYVRDDGQYDVRGNFVCDNCINEYYTYPVENDGELYHRDGLYYWESDGQHHLNPEPDEDEDEDESSCIHDYSTDVLHYCARDERIESSQYGEFLMGVELEVEAEHGYRGDAARDTDEHFAGYALLKRDGSLNNGFEIVTAPRGLAEHLRRFDEWWPHDELTAWDAGTCGLHVHIDSRAFGSLTLGKFIKFICADENKGLITAVAGRHWNTDDQAKSYCSGKEAGGGEISTVLRRKAGNSSRYTAVNMCLGLSEWRRLMGDVPRTSVKSSNTVELRIFRASLRKARLLSQIEFTHAAVRFCRWAGNNELTEDAFRSWLSKRTREYKNLSAFLKVKKVKPRPGATTPAAEPAEA